MQNLLTIDLIKSGKLIERIGITEDQYNDIGMLDYLDLDELRLFVIAHGYFNVIKMLRLFQHQDKQAELTLELYNPVKWEN